MRIVIALGGNAISKRGEPITIANQRTNIRAICATLAHTAQNHELVITHGNGPQVGLLALRNDAYTEVAADPLDVLGAESQGMIGYLLEMEMRNAMAPTQMLTTILTLVEVDKDDPAFREPTKFVGPVYTEEQAHSLEESRSWIMRNDDGGFRRVVASPAPTRVIQVDSCKRLLAAGHIVVAGGGGGVPVARDSAGNLVGLEGVVDKDASSALLARSIDADLLIMATDADAVYLEWGTPQARRIRTCSPEDLAHYPFPAGSMGPKATAAQSFARSTGHTAVIGRLEDLEDILAGQAGTRISAGAAWTVDEG